MKTRTIPNACVNSLLCPLMTEQNFSATSLLFFVAAFIPVDATKTFRTPLLPSRGLSLEAGQDVGPEVDEAQPQLLLDRVAVHVGVDVQVLLRVAVELGPGDRHAQASFVGVSVWIQDTSVGQTARAGWLENYMYFEQNNKSSLITVLI